MLALREPTGPGRGGGALSKLKIDVDSRSEGASTSYVQHTHTLSPSKKYTPNDLWLAPFTQWTSTRLLMCTDIGTMNVVYIISLSWQQTSKHNRTSKKHSIK